MYDTGWGLIAAPNESCWAIRFELGRNKNGGCIQSISIPYNWLVRWEYNAEPSKLEIEGAGRTITLTGKNMDEIVEHLDKALIAVVREQGETKTTIESEKTWIETIVVQSMNA